MKYLLTITFFALLVWQSDAISCYSCNGYSCYFVISSELGSSTACSSCTTSTSYINSAVLSVTRSCSYSSCSYGYSSSVVSGSGTINECCASSSGCNSITKTSLGTVSQPDSVKYSCYSCSGSSCSSSSSSYSSSSQKSSGCNYCQTLTTSSSLSNTVDRSCASYCTASDITILGVRTTTKCCTSDLCNGPEDSLTCYTSSYQKSSGCSYCKTVTTYSSLSSSTVDRSCATSCTASDYTLFGVRTKTDCCTSSLCNGATKNVSRNLFNLILPLCTLLLIVASKSILGEH